MNEDLVLAITMLIILAVVVLFIQISQQIKVKRIQKMKIQRRFGEIPDMEEVLPIEKISVYHKHQGREDVDQVTLFSSYKNNYTYHRNTSNAKNHIHF